MSVLHNMLPDQHNTLSPHHITSAHSAMLSLPRFGRKMRSVSPASLSAPDNFGHSRKRAHSDQPEKLTTAASAKRSRTVPSSPCTSPVAASFDRERTTPTQLPKLSEALGQPHQNSRWTPLANTHTSREYVSLPSLSDTLAHASPTKVKPPTVSLDYFDTYKPNDENWRYGLLDLIRHSKAENAYYENVSRLPPILSLQLGRPHFDARVAKLLPVFPERKVNFPYESNYTYLNSTYMRDVERYPEYLELARSLVLLSRPIATPTSSPQHPHCLHHGRDLMDAAHDRPSLLDRHRQSPCPRNAPYSPQRTMLPQYTAHPTTTHQPSYHREYSSQHTRQFHPAPPLGPEKHGRPEYSLPVLSPSSPKYTSHGYAPLPYSTPDGEFRLRAALPKASPSATKFIPITPPSIKDKTRSELMKSPPRTAQSLPRVCILCGLDQSPCWRPLWSTKEGQLCNLCGLRYKKTAARCLNSDCKKIPAKGEWALMQTRGKVDFSGERAYACLDCGGQVEVRK